MNGKCRNEKFKAVCVRHVDEGQFPYSHWDVYLSSHALGEISKWHVHIVLTAKWN